MTDGSAAIPVARSNFVRAILLVLAGMAFFAVQDAAVKEIAVHVSIWQFMLVRSVIVIGLVGVLMGWFRPRAGFKLVHPGWAALRGLIMGGAYLAFYLSLPFLPLAVAAAAFFTGPLFITLFAGVFLGEGVGPRRVTAIVVGFIGVVLVLQPGAIPLSVAALLPLVAAICYALCVIITRYHLLEDSAVALSMVMGIVFAQIGMAGLAVVSLAPPSESLREAWPFLSLGWSEAPPIAWALMVATAFTHVIGAIAITQCYQLEKASKIAPFEYVYLPMAVMIDVVVWDLTPTPLVFLGMALIAAAGSFIAWREGRPVRPRPQTHGEAQWRVGAKR